MCEPGLHIIHLGPSESDQSSEPEIDVVAVHGLNFKNNPNHARATWTWSATKTLWIREYLPSTLKRPCRVLLFAYNSSPAMGAAAMRLDDHAKMLLQCLLEKREGTTQRPIIFLCHSLGGIVVKSALVEATLNPTYKSIVNSTRLLVFFATPHLGGNYSKLGDVAARLVRTTLRNPSNDLLDGLKKGSKDVLRRFEQSRHLPEACLVISFYETEDYGRLGLIVERESAVLNLPADREKQVPLQANHSKLCKFSTKADALPVMDCISSEFERALHEYRNLKPKYENTHWLVPRNTTPLFMGRDKIMSKITDAISPKTKQPSLCQKVFVLTGIGGQGKSEVCLRIVNQFRTQFWGVFWVDVSSRATAVTGFVKIARALGSATIEIDEILFLLANCSADHTWILVLDNADDENIDYQEFMPTGNRGTILMTSRISECQYHSTVGHEEVSNLDEEECVTLLLKASRKPESLWAESYASAKVVAKDLGYHTLALVQAGAFIALGRCSMEEYPDLFKRQRKELLKFGSAQSQPRYRNVYATFEVSVRNLESSKEESARDALELLNLFSAMHFDHIPLEIFEDIQKGKALALEGNNENPMGRLDDWHVERLPSFIHENDVETSRNRLSSALKYLGVLSLISKSADAMGFEAVSLHPLIHSWIGARQDQAERFTVLQSASCLFSLWHYGKVEWKPYKDRLGLHLSSLLNAPCFVNDALGLAQMRQNFYLIGFILLDSRSNRELESLLNTMFEYFNISPSCPTNGFLPLYFLKALSQRNLGNIKQSIDSIGQILEGQEICEPKFRGLKTMFETALARAYLMNGQTKKAIMVFEEIEQTLDPRCGSDDLFRLSLRYQLGVAYGADGQRAKTLTMMEDISSIELQSLQEEDPNLAATAYELAQCYHVENRVKDAINLLRNTILKHRKYMSDTHPTMLTLHYGLARALISDFQLKEAIEILEKVLLQQSEITDSDHHPLQLATLVTLGSAYQISGQTKDAITAYERALRLYKCDEAHPNRLDTQYQLSISYLADGQRSKAISLLERTKSLQEITMHENHPALVRVQLELGNAYKEVGDLSRGLNLLEKAVKIQEKSLDESHPNRLGALYQLGLAYLDDDQLKRAISLFEKIVRIEQRSSEVNPDKAVSKLALGRAYLADGQVEAAMKLFEEVVALLQSSWNPSHPDVLSAKHELARSYFSNGRIQEARIIFEEVIKVQATSLPANHPNQLASQRLLGLTLLQLGQKEEALNLLEEVFRAESEDSDTNDQSLFSTQRALAKARLANKHFEGAIELYEHLIKRQSDKLAPHHSDLLETKKQLGSAYLSLNRTEDAIAILEEVVSVYAMNHEPDHAGKLGTEHSLGSAYLKSGNIPRAMEMLEGVVHNQAYLHASHPNRLASEYDLAQCYLNVGRSEDAVKMMQEVVRKETLILEKDNPSRIKSVQLLGFAYMSNELARDAIECFGEVASVYLKAFGIQDERYLLAQYDLAAAYVDDSQPRKATLILKEALKTTREMSGQRQNLRAKFGFELASAYLDREKAGRAIELLEEVEEIKQRDANVVYPSWDKLQGALTRARKANRPVYKLRSVLGLNGEVVKGAMAD